MPSYSNGRVPRSALISFGSGRDKDGRYYEWLLPPRTYRKHVALVELGRQRSGRTLRPSVGYSCYRPLDEQHYARSVHGIYAATPGTSSHGGDWSGPPTGWRKVDAAAIDYSNYIEVFGSEEAFFDACRRVGLTPKGIWPPAFPREAWHVIDLDNPYGPLPAGQNVDDFEEDDMYTEEDRKRDREAAEHASAAYAALFGPKNLNGGSGPDKMTWYNPFGEPIGEAYYGLLPISIHTQALVGKQAGQVAALQAMVEQLASANGAVLDMAAIEAAAERGAREALADLKVTIEGSDG